jgi:hypothetical protein
MSIEVAKGTATERRSIRVAAWMALAAVPYFVWKTMVAALAGSLNPPLIMFLATLSVCVAVVFFIVGVILGRYDGARAASKGGSKAISVTTWFTIGFIADLLFGLLAASYLSQVASSLGDVQAGSFWSDISVAEASLFVVFSLGGGIAGSIAANSYYSRK